MSAQDRYGAVAYLRPVPWPQAIGWAMQADDPVGAMQRGALWAAEAGDACSWHEPYDKGPWWRAWNYTYVALMACAGVADSVERDAFAAGYERGYGNGVLDASHDRYEHGDAGPGYAAWRGE